MPSSNKDKFDANKILESSEFRDSQVYSSLLTYLLKCAESSQVPKEITIAIDVFDKDTRFNSNKDSTVRYHIHMLRKKLDDYYKKEGKKDKIRLVIPKGHYEIKFTSCGNGNNIGFSTLLSLIRHWKVIFIITLLVGNVYWLSKFYLSSNGKFQKANIIESNNKIWKSFFENGYPVSIIIGDDFLLDEYCEDYQYYRQIRDWNINSENDLSNFLIRYPNAKVWRSEITGFPFGGVNNLMDILPVVYQFQKDVTLNLSSVITLDEIRNHNIIYIGELRNLRMLDKIFSKTPVRYQYQPNEQLFILNEEADTLETFLRIQAPYAQTDKYNVDYSVIVKMPGFSNENLMFIAGFGYGGRLQQTKMLANPEMRQDFINEMMKTTGEVPDYYLAVFEIQSIERTGFTNELKYFQKLSRDFFK